MATTTCKSPEEEARFWKEKALALKTELDDCRQEYQEYVDESKSLESELDLELKQSELKCKDLNAVVQKYKNENEVLRTRLENQTMTEARQHGEMSTELAALKTQIDDFKKHIRQLEQKNDDLERTNRANTVSIEDFEIKLNNAIEKNVILESELDEKDALKAHLQRLKDETRDLKSELNCKVQDSNRVTEIVPAVRPPRVSPLSIVNDLLRKVGALETKLATYRKEEPTKRHKRTGDVIKT